MGTEKDASYSIPLKNKIENIKHMLIYFTHFKVIMTVDDENWLHLHLMKELGTTLVFNNILIQWNNPRRLEKGLCSK